MLAIELPVYRRWEDVPRTLATRTQLRREGFDVPEARLDFPDAAIRRYSHTYSLYSRSWAVLHEVKRPRKDYSAIFAARYEQYAVALPDACEALFQLNRYVKHEECSVRERVAIYDLKNRLLARLFQDDYCAVACPAATPTKQLGCWDCCGTGKGWYDDEDDEYHYDETCPKCGGTGVFRTVGGKPYWAFRFVVGGKPYRWHQPAHLAPWAHAVGEPSEDEQRSVTVAVEPVTLPRRRFPEAKALIAWVCDEADRAERDAMLTDVPF